MKQPITDKAEVSIDFPDKYYVGAFGRGATFDVIADDDGIHLHLDRSGQERRRVGLHIHYPLLAEILVATAEAIRQVGALGQEDTERMGEAARLLAAAVAPRR